FVADLPELPCGCRYINPDIFNNVLCKENLRTFLGTYCEKTYASSIKGGDWIGDVGPAVGECKVCCIHKDKRGVISYKVTSAPNTLPCGSGKV
ncbi:secreted protein, putative, partial [Ixodes scapularis]